MAPEKVIANTKGDAKTRRRAETEALEAMKRAKTLRNHTRAIPGVPIVYVKRSVMVLEPMSAPSEGVRDGLERGKFRVGLNEPTLGKRKRDGDGDAGGGDGANAEGTKKKNKKDKKVKGPNPLSVKKPKKRDLPASASGSKKETKEGETLQGDEPERKEGDSSAPKPKRRRRHHHKSGNEADGGNPGEPESTAPEPAE